MTRPVLYIDVDGVLFGRYGEPETFQLRPGVSSFLIWCCANFRCRWLTAWSNGRIASLLADGYCSAALDIKHTCWGEAKSSVIDFDEPLWMWIEDGLMDRDRVVLEQHGCLDNYRYVNPDGADELLAVRDALAAYLRRHDLEVHPGNSPLILC